MSRRRLAAVPDLPGAAPDDDATATAFEVGRTVGQSEVERDATGMRFAKGLALGVSLAMRICAGDVDLARQLEAVLDAPLPVQQPTRPARQPRPVRRPPA